MNPYQTLIADDSTMITKIIKKALLANSTDLHFEESAIFIARDGMEAFEIMASKPDIKLIITDINMPHLNGDEFIEILQDTNKLEHIDVIFVTSTKIILKPEIKNKILGVIYKPFNTTTFNEKMHQLYIDNKERVKRKRKIQKQQKVQKEIVLQISKAYLKRYDIEYKQKLLDAQICNNFHDESIDESEYSDIVHATLSLYLFEIESSHVVNIKQIRCIIKEQNKKIKHEKNRFGLIREFEEILKEIQKRELSNKELLNELIGPINEKVSLILASVKRYPKQVIKRFSTHFNYIAEEFNKIDCEFMDDSLSKSLSELQEISEFKAWLEEFLEDNKICIVIPAIKKNSQLHNAIHKHLKSISIKNERAMQHYCGAIDAYIWKKAKESKEIITYLQQKLHMKMPNSLEFLRSREKYTLDKYKQDYKLDHQKVIVISNSLDILETFKSLTASPFDNWSFHLFTKKSTLEVWLKANIPHRIIVDYNYTTQDAKNGIEFIAQMATAYPILDKIIKRHQLFLITNNSDVAKVQKTKIKFIIINAKLTSPEITKTLLYH